MGLLASSIRFQRYVFYRFVFPLFQPFLSIVKPSLVKCIHRYLESGKAPRCKAGLMLRSRLLRPSSPFGCLSFFISRRQFFSPGLLNSHIPKRFRNRRAIQVTGRTVCINPPFIESPHIQNFPYAGTLKSRTGHIGFVNDLLSKTNNTQQFNGIPGDSPATVQLIVENNLIIHDFFLKMII